MVRINKIYTKTGDDGTTGLVGGSRVDKDSLRVECYGDIDELNSLLGWVHTLAIDNRVNSITEKLDQIQQELFDIGAELATPPGVPPGMRGPGSIPTDSSQVARLEQQIDELTENLPELTSFVLPGGTPLNSALHLARTVCRRAERKIVSLNRSEPVNLQLRIYLNRLSDLLFAMARFESFRSKVPEKLWVPRKSNP